MALQVLRNSAAESGRQTIRAGAGATKSDSAVNATINTMTGKNTNRSE